MTSAATAVTVSRDDFNYYEDNLRAGFDMLAYGYWHQSYGRAVTEATLQESYEEPYLVDAGAGCGTTLRAFVETGIYARFVGIDLSARLVELGRTHFGFTESELVQGSIEQLSLADGVATLVHTAQVLEHLPEAVIPQIFAEFYRVLRPGGRMFHNWAAVKHEQDPVIYQHPTHINVKPILYWAQAFAEAGFLPDFESYDRFARSPAAPAPDYPNFYTHYAEYWAIAAYIKPE